MSPTTTNMHARGLGRTLLWLIAILLAVVGLLGFLASWTVSRQPDAAQGTGAQGAQSAHSARPLIAALAVAPAATATPATTTPPAAIPPAAKLINLPADARVVVIALADLSKGQTPPPDFLLLTVSRQSRPGVNTPDVTFITVPTDTLVYIPGWRSHTIAQAFVRGGPGLLKDTIKYNFGLNVDRYLVMDVNGALEVIDEYGGAKVFGRCKLDAQVTLPDGQVAEVHIPRPAAYTLTGPQAYAYAYAPYNDPNTQVALGRRGEEIVRGLYRVGKPAGLLKDPAKLTEMYNEYAAIMQTDLSLTDLLDLYVKYAQGASTHAHSRSIAEAGVTRTTLSDVGSVLVISRDALSTYLRRALQVLLPQQSRNEITVEVWNGTDEVYMGLAAADRLSELGYKVVDLGKTPRAADKLYEHTTLIDLSGAAKGNATAALQRQFGLQAANVQPATKQTARRAAQPQYRLIVGADFDPCAY